MNDTAEYLRSPEALQQIEIGRLVNLIIRDAVTAGASDIHIEPWESMIVVRIRLNGVLTELVHLPLDLLENISGRLKVMANLVSYETGLPQEGHASADPEFGGAELRVSVFPGVRGEKIVVRIFDPGNRAFSLHALGLEDETLEALEVVLQRPNGLILLTGPTGSGKTTVLYSSLCHIVREHGPRISISTVEDPVEFHLDMVSQAQVNPAKKFTYPVALRSLMRQDPDVIMIGEIRDAETAGIAVQAGLTGHMVMSTIHSGSTVGVFARLINMQIEPFLLASSIVGVLGLRLARSFCGDCIEPLEEGREAVLEALPEALRPEAQLRRSRGCEACLETGFQGRVSVTEMLSVDESLREAVVQKLATKKLHQVAVDRGMVSLWDMGMRRVARGETSLEEIMRVIASDA